MTKRKRAFYLYTAEGSTSFGGFVRLDANYSSDAPPRVMEPMRIDEQRKARRRAAREKHKQTDQTNAVSAQPTSLSIQPQVRLASPFAFDAIASSLLSSALLSSPTAVSSEPVSVRRSRSRRPARRRRSWRSRAPCASSSRTGACATARRTS